ncbi:TPA: glycosyltransferase family 2 protein [Pseudomonas aeruginosa]
MGVDVSILMPVYNEVLHLEEALQSISEQGEKLSIEVVCVDDFSTDGTWQLMEQLRNKYSFLKCYKNEKKGKNNAFNFAYERSSGGVVVLLAGDDKLVPNTLRARVDPVLDQDENFITLCKYRTFSKTKYLDGMVFPKDRELGSLSGGTIAFNRRFAERVFPIPPVLGNEDMWIKCHATYAEDVNVIHVPVVSLLYRLHDNNSLKRDVGFSKKNEMISKRSIVYSVCLERYRGELSVAVSASLAKLAALETLRANRSILSILFFKNIPLVDKLRAIVYASPLLHWIHIRLLRWTSRT